MTSKGPEKSAKDGGGSGSNMSTPRRGSSSNQSTPRGGNNDLDLEGFTDLLQFSSVLGDRTRVIQEVKDAYTKFKTYLEEEGQVKLKSLFAKTAEGEGVDLQQFTKVVREAELAHTDEVIEAFFLRLCAQSGGCKEADIASKKVLLSEILACRLKEWEVEEERLMGYVYNHLKLKGGNERIMKIIAEADVDGDGRLELAEFERCITNLVGEHSLRNLTGAFKLLDRNEDGNIELAELLHRFMDMDENSRDNELKKLQQSQAAAVGAWRGKRQRERLLGKVGADALSRITGAGAAKSVSIVDPQEDSGMEMSPTNKAGTMDAANQDKQLQKIAKTKQANLKALQERFGKEHADRMNEKRTLKQDIESWKDSLASNEATTPEEMAQKLELMEKVSTAMEELEKVETDIEEAREEFLAAQATLQLTREEERVLRGLEALTRLKVDPKQTMDKDRSKRFASLYKIDVDFDSELAADSEMKVDLERLEAAVTRLQHVLLDGKGDGSAKAIDVDEVFSRFDKDGNHELDLDEWLDCMKLLGVSEHDHILKAVFARYDEDGTGAVDFNEIREEMVLQSSIILRGFEEDLQMALMARGKNVRNIFNKYEEDQNGWLDMEEFEKFIGDLLPTYKGKSIEIRQLYEKIDRDGDQQVTLSELMKWCGVFMATKADQAKILEKAREKEKRKNERMKAMLEERMAIKQQQMKATEQFEAAKKDLTKIDGGRRGSNAVPPTIAQQLDAAEKKQEIIEKMQELTEHMQQIKDDEKMAALKWAAKRPILMDPEEERSLQVARLRKQNEEEKKLAAEELESKDYQKKVAEIKERGRISAHFHRIWKAKQSTINVLQGLIDIMDNDAESHPVGGIIVEPTEEEKNQKEEVRGTILSTIVDQQHKANALKGLARKSRDFTGSLEEYSDQETLAEKEIKEFLPTINDLVKKVTGKELDQGTKDVLRGKKTEQDIMSPKGSMSKSLASQSFFHSSSNLQRANSTRFDRNTSSPSRRNSMCNESTPPPKLRRRSISPLDPSMAPYPSSHTLSSGVLRRSSLLPTEEPAAPTAAPEAADSTPAPASPKASSKTSQASMASPTEDPKLKLATPASPGSDRSLTPRTKRLKALGRGDTHWGYDDLSATPVAASTPTNKSTASTAGSQRQLQPLTPEAKVERAKKQRAHMIKLSMPLLSHRVPDNKPPAPSKKLAAGETGRMVARLYHDSIEQSNKRREQKTNQFYRYEEPRLMSDSQLKENVDRLTQADLNRRGETRKKLQSKYYMEAPLSLIGQDVVTESVSRLYEGGMSHRESEIKRLEQKYTFTPEKSKPISQEKLSEMMARLANPKYSINEDHPDFFATHGR